MKNYQDLIRRIIETGTREVNRTGTATLSVVSGELRWNMADGVPAVTTKKLAVRPVIGEALWFLAGSSDINALRVLTNIGPDDFCIWQQNLDELNARRAEYPQYEGSENDLGYVYGPAWRYKYGAGSCHSVDQIQILINNINAIKENPAHPSRRRLIVDTWDATVHNDGASLDCALPPCHYGFQCFVQGDKLSLKWIQRSVDVFLGLPFNILSYAFILHVLAKMTGLVPHELIFSGGDLHIYENHIDQCQEILRREPMKPAESFIMPDEMTLQDFTDQKFTAQDFGLVGYQSHGVLKGLMS